MPGRPVILISPDLLERHGRETVSCALTYSDAIWEAGGLPIVATPDVHLVDDLLAMADGVVLTGGDDPATERFGEATDPRVTGVFPRRQRFEEALLDGVLASGMAVLGVCLGMQMLALKRGGRLDQYMPETVPTHAEHWDANHPVESSVPGVMGSGVVRSKHKQAIVDPGSLRVVARAPDGVIEGVDDPEMAFCVGVQWHPERTADPTVGLALFERLVNAARSSRG